MNQFKPGDVVVLKSQPQIQMTIEKQNTDNTYFCIWIDFKTKKAHNANFAEIVLKLYKSHAGITYLRNA